MSPDKHEVIPVDTHVHQIAMKHFGMSGSSNFKMAMRPKLYDEASNKFAAVLGMRDGRTRTGPYLAD